MLAIIVALAILSIVCLISGPVVSGKSAELFSDSLDGLMAPWKDRCA